VRHITPDHRSIGSIGKRSKRERNRGGQSLQDCREPTPNVEHERPLPWASPSDRSNQRTVLRVAFGTRRPFQPFRIEETPLGSYTKKSSVEQFT